MQLPYYRQREQQDYAVLKDAQTGASEANGGGDRQALCIGDGLVPDGADGETLEDHKEEEHQTVQELSTVSLPVDRGSTFVFTMNATIPRTLHLNHLMKSGNKREYSERIATFEKICTAT